MVNFLNEARVGDSVSKMFDSNFGVNTSLYGEPVDGKHCILGMTTISLNYNSSSNSAPVSFDLAFAGNQVSDILYSNANLIQLEVGCFGFSGDCPPETYFDSNNSICSPCSLGCQQCLNYTYCITCSANQIRVISDRVSYCKVTSTTTTEES